jgi:hypothetical protein
MQILQDKRKCSLATILVARFTDCARGGSRKECTVVSLAVVVAGGAKAEWSARIKIAGEKGHQLGLKSGE